MPVVVNYSIGSRDIFTMGASPLWLIICLTALGVPVSATNHSCPTWFYYSNTTQRCECGVQYRWILCNQQTKEALIKSSYCVTYSRQEGLFYSGECRLSFKPNKTNRLFSRLPADPDLLDEMMCGPYNRNSLMCGKCIDGYGSGVLNAINEKCVDCSKLSMGSAVCFYILVDFVPTLLFFVFMLVFRFDVLSGPMLTYVIFCQGTSIALMQTPLIIYNTVYEHVPLYLGGMVLMVIEFWNLNLFKSIIPPFCISDKLTRLHIIFLNSSTNFCQLFLVIIFVILSDVCSRKNNKLLSLALKMTRIKRVTTDAVIRTFASFLFLSSTKSLFLFTSLTKRTPVFSNVNTSVFEQVLYADTGIKYYSRTHIIFLLLALLQCVLVVFIPSLLLFLYPTRVYRWASQFISVRKQLAITTFVEAMNHCLKNGLNGTTDHRAFAGVFIFAIPMLGMWNKIVRLITFSQYSHILVYFFVASGVSLFLSYSRPFKTTVGNLSASFYCILFGGLSLVVYLCLEDESSSNETLTFMLTPLLILSQVPVLIWALYNLATYIYKRSSARE